MPSKEFCNRYAACSAHAAAAALIPLIIALVRQEATLVLSTARFTSIMKPHDVVELAMGIIVGACVLRPDVAGIPSTRPDSTPWPNDIPLETMLGDSDRVYGDHSIPSSPLTKARRTPPRAFAVFGRALTEGRIRSMAPRVAEPTKERTGDFIALDMHENFFGILASTGG